MDRTDAQVTKETVAGEVRAWLGRRNRSGRSVARELGWTEPYLSRRLTGSVPFDVADLVKIADLLDVPVATFFEYPIPASTAVRTRVSSILADNATLCTPMFPAEAGLAA